MTRIQTPVQLAQLVVRALRLRGRLRLDETRRTRVERLKSMHYWLLSDFSRAAPILTYFALVRGP
jgi:hypothetical protein